MTNTRTQSPARADFARMRQLLEMQRRMTELVAIDAPLTSVLDTLCKEVEGLFVACRCTVMLLQDRALRMAAAPNVPPSVVSMADGVELGAGTCGVAAATGRTVITEDTMTDPGWAPYRDVAAAANVAACWSIPILSSRDEVLGTFAIYLAERLTPDEVELEILETAARAAALAIARDRAEGSLRSAEDTYRTIFDSVNDAIFIHDLDTGQILDVNPRMCELYGFTREEARRLSVADISAADEGYDNQRAARLVRLAAEGHPQVFEWRSRHASGRKFWVEVNLRRAELDGTDRVLAVVRDINERKEAEDARRASEARLSTIVSNSPDFIMLIDLDLRIQFINRTLSAYTIEETIGTSVLDYVDEHAQQEMLACFERVRNSLATDRYEVRHVTPDGTARTFETRVAPILDDATLTSFALSATDITARRLAERAIVESEERFRQLTEAITDVFWLTNWQDRRVVYVSPSYERLWGRSCQSLYDDARSWADAIHPDDIEHATRAFYGSAERGEYDLEYRIIRPDGSVRWIHDKAFPIRDEQGAVVRMAGVSQDVTQRKIAEEELQRTSESERILRRELDHRVRNNLASLMTLIDMSVEGATDISAFAETIKGRVNAMATCHSFLSRSSWSPLDLRVIVDALVPTEFAGRIELEGPPAEVPAYQCNALAIVLHEIFHNSVKHGALGARDGTVRLAWTADPGPDDEIHLQLQINEIGGPPIEQTPVPGVGSRLIEGLVRWELGGSVKLSYPRDGINHTLDLVLRAS